MTAIASLSNALLPVISRVSTCQACASMRFTHVLGDVNGPVPGRVMFVGEAPGRLGAGRTGVPFSGDESGRRFEAFLAMAGLRRKEVFVTNAVLCNPVGATGNNRRPLTSEVRRCAEHLSAQIDAVQPEVVVALGEVALSALGRIEGHALSLRESVGIATPWAGRTLVALYHPGRRATVHRKDQLQQADWRALGALLKRRLRES
jgi:uracil-DNA glycosylase family 4